MTDEKELGVLLVAYLRSMQLANDAVNGLALKGGLDNLPRIQV